MGIIILVFLSLGIFSAGRAVFNSIKVYIQDRKPTAAQPSPAAEISGETNWAAYNVPAFVRRGVAYPVLVEVDEKNSLVSDLKEQLELPSQAAIEAKPKVKNKQKARKSKWNKSSLSNLLDDVNTAFENATFENQMTEAMSLM